MKAQANLKEQTFDLTEFQSKEMFTTSVTLYKSHKKWMDDKENNGNKINLSKIVRSVLDQLMAAEKKK